MNIISGSVSVRSGGSLSRLAKNSSCDSTGAFTSSWKPDKYEGPSYYMDSDGALHPLPLTEEE